MDTFTVMLGTITIAITFLGEIKKVGAYLWIAGLFAILFSMRMAEPGFHIVSAAFVVVLIMRSQLGNEDVVETDEID